MKKAALIAIAFLLFGCICTPGVQTDPFDLVPSSATSVAIISPSLILNDPDFAYFYSKANPGQSLEGEFSEMQELAGFQMRNVSKAVLFSIGTGAAEKSAAFFKGGFDSSAAERRIRSDPSLGETQYEGYSIFRKQGEENAITFIDGSLLIGAPSAVQSAIDVKKGKTQSIRSNAKLIGVLNKLDSDAEFIQVSESAGALPSELTSPPLNASAFSAVRASGVHINKQLQNVNAKFVLLTGSSGEAGALRSSLSNLFSTISSLFARPGSRLEGLLGKIAVSQEDEYVIMALQTTVDELKAVEAELAAS